MPIPQHPVINTPGQMRRASGLLLPASSGSPLVKVTPNLGMRLVWVEGTAHCPYEWIETREAAEKYLPKFFDDSFRRFADKWMQEKEGHVLAPFRASRRPPPRTGHRWHQIGRYWCAGPYEALDRRPLFVRDSEGNDVQVARRMTLGDEHLDAVNGQIAYRFADYFVMREHLAELPVRRSRRSRQ